MTEYRPKKKSRLLHGEMSEDAVLYDEETKEIHVLNPTAFLVWKLCDGGHSVEDIEQAVKREFSTRAGQEIAEDIQKIVDTFKDKGLLEEAS